MKKLIMAVAIGLFGFNLTGCAPLLVVAIQRSRANAVNTDCGKFQGESIDEAVLVYGVPNSSYTFSTGEKLYSWLRVGGSSVNEYGNVYTARCRIQFKTDTKGLVSSCQYSGDCGKSNKLK